ncbi:MAG: hypothetical protein ACRD1T_05300, partial [Acidimicrobiia bacterium]
MLFLFALTLFTSSALLFLIQPMFAKMALPLLGGTPAVWNTCVVFFQSALLAGYVYAHVSTRYLGLRRQAVLHAVLLFTPLLALPIAIGPDWIPPSSSNPIPWLLRLLSVSVGLPFFVISTSAPLLQKWFAGTPHPSASDPYFLYRASNLGSMAALLAYPTILEPTLRLRDQSWWWGLSYAVFVALTLLCAVVVWRHVKTADKGVADASVVRQEQRATERLSVTRRVRWIALSFVPSSLMLGLTTHLTTDIAAVPLLWILPLTLYLLTFVLTFSPAPMLRHAWMVRALPLLLLPLLVVLLPETVDPWWLVIPLNLVMFFVAAMVCHGELARDRPSTAYLTEFYLWISVGGVLGGLFNALLAPLIFNRILEYPVALVFASLLLPPRSDRDKSAGLASTDILHPLALGAFVALIGLALRLVDFKPGPSSVLLMFGAPALICFRFKRRPVRFGLGVGMIMLASVFYPNGLGRVLHVERSFFGVHRVVVDPARKYHVLLHGTTIHGRQSLDPARRAEALTYFYRTGPIGQLFTTLKGSRPHKVAVIGLGSGSLACYAEAGQRWTFYEIDPEVERIARDPKYFTFLRDSKARIDVVLG